MQTFKITLISTILMLTVSSTVVSQEKDLNKNIRVIELSGNGYERGLQHGKLLKNEIADVYKKWKDDIALDSKKNPDSVLHQFYIKTNFEPAIKKWTPEIYDEVRGIAAGSGQSMQDVLCFQLVDEFWVYIDKLVNINKEHCSGIGVAATKSAPAYVAQNMDLETFRNGYQILLHISKNKMEPEQYILSCAGLVALNGVNSHGIAMAVNSLMQLNASDDGLPVAYIVRGVLAQRNEKQALKFLQNVKHASGQNYILGAGDNVYDFEASAAKVVRFTPISDNSSIVYHTNHPIVNDDVKPWHKKRLEKVLSGNTMKDNSLDRYQALKNRIDVASISLSENTIKETLRSKDSETNPVCVRYNKERNVFTFSSVIFTLGKKPTIQITNGSPDQAEYSLHTFKE